VRPEFDHLLEEQHSLHESALTGEPLRQVAELDGRSVARLAFTRRRED